MKNAMKKGSMLALVFALLFSPLAMSALYAANGIETDRTDASIAFCVGTEYKELDSLEIPVKLYRVAEVNEAGVYTEEEEFKHLKLSNVNAETTAEEWREKAAEAVQTVEEKQILPEKEVILNNPENPENKAENLPVGLYLVQTEEVKSLWYEYSFSPFLLSVPNNYYDPQDSASSDDWIYQVETELKPEQKDLYGELIIQKKLVSYNETLGDAFFVFQIEAVKEGKNVYSDVVSLNFNEPGQKELLVSHIPAGAEVTVTEIYSGASYTTVSGKEQSAVIIAEEMEGNPVSVSFENKYDQRINGGSGIVNHFKFENNKWDYQQEADSNGGAWKPSVDKKDEQDQTQASDREEVKESEIESNAGEEGGSRVQKASSTHRDMSAVDNQTASGSKTAETVDVVRADLQEAALPLQEEPEENPAAEEDRIEAEDESVPLADMVKDILSDENNRLRTVVGTAALAVVMTAAFSIVWFRKRARINARNRRILIKRK